MDENKIVIVSDDNNVINFDDITIKHDTIDRNEVCEVENAIAKLESENADFESKIAANNEQINELKDKLAYAKKVIAIADAQKEVEVPVVDNAEIQTVNVEY
ncbi:MAG: hypothetical protein IJ301_02175 [Clostridia bacterium]|nr:hypothetical protein [Clostridia bacterium]